MSNLFNIGDFDLHSGSKSKFKIDCDVLSDDDLATLAKMFASYKSFSSVESIPTGGDRFAKALVSYAQPDSNHPVLIVDDVMTTGTSMENKRARRMGAIGVVIFSRSKFCPWWITPIFTLHPCIRNV